MILKIIKVFEDPMKLPNISTSEPSMSIRDMAEKFGLDLDKKYVISQLERKYGSVELVLAE